VSSGAILPPIAEVPEDQKFDGGVKTTWTAVKRRIVNTLKTQGLYGYTDGTILKPGESTLAQQAAVAAAGASASAAAGTQAASITPIGIVIVMPLFHHSTPSRSSEYTFCAGAASGLLFVFRYQIMDQYFIQGIFIGHRLLSRVRRN
jgi:hypothetical protein